MLYHKTGLPDDSELVQCTVSKIHHNAVFVTLNHYGKQAMLHISEISPGRIRNIRDYVKEGKIIICKVLSVRKERDHIDVSLRRVSESQRMQYVNQMKLEISAERIVEFFCKEHKLDVKKTYELILKTTGYEFLSNIFSDYIQNEYDFKNSGLEPKLHKEFISLITQRIKPPQVEIGAKFTIFSFANDGVIKLREAFKRAVKVDSEHLNITYGGNGNYNVRIVHKDFKSAEKIFKEVHDILAVEFEEKKDAQFSFEKNEGKQIA